MNDFSIERDTVIRCANECGLGGLLMLLSVQMHTYGGTCGASARQLAATACVHPTTAAKHLRDLAIGGFVKERRSAGRVWREVVQSGDGHTIEMDGDRPSIESTSGFRICSKNCRAYAERDSK